MLGETQGAFRAGANSGTEFHAWLLQAPSVVFEMSLLKAVEIHSYLAFRLVLF